MSLNFTVIVPRWFLWVKLYVLLLCGLAWITWTAFQMSDEGFRGLRGIVEIFGIVIAAHLLGSFAVAIDWKLDGRRAVREAARLHERADREFALRQESRHLDREAGRARVAAAWARADAIKAENNRRYGAD